MEDFKKKGLELMVGLAVTEKARPEVIPYEPQKLFVSGPEAQYFRRRPGGKGGKYARTLINLLTALENERAANVHSIIVIKDGEAILDASAPGYNSNCAHLAHSMSKTITAIAIGILVDDEKLSLDEHIVDFFPELESADMRITAVTVEDLLTMKSSVPFGELGTVTSDSWCESFFLSELTEDPGTKFNYNSMNSYILANIAMRITGKSLTEFVTERLLSPLKIENFFWELSPEGAEKGGMGVYMSAESFAKIGVMLLNRGEFAGKRVLSENFVEKMLTTHSLAPLEKGAFNYGYHIWTSRTGDDFLLSGMLGQIVWVNPKNNLVVAVNSGNNEVFQDSATLGIVREHLSVLDEGARATFKDKRELSAKVKKFFVDRHWIRPLVPKRSLLTYLGVKPSMPRDAAWDKITGEYAFPENNVSLLPLLVSVMQNNYSGGIERISLTYENDRLCLTSTEGGRTFNIPVGLYDFAPSVQNYDGEPYRVCAIAEAIEDEDRHPVYKIELVFPELPNTRIIKIYPTDNGIRMRLAETPNNAIAEKFIGSLMDGRKYGFAMNMIERKVGEDFIEKKLESIFNPTLLAVNTALPNWESVLQGWNDQKNEQTERSGRLVRTMVSKFVGEAALTKDTAAPKREKSESFLGKAGKAISTILSKRQKTKKSKSNEAYTEIHVLPPVAETDKEKDDGMNA